MAEDSTEMLDTIIDAIPLIANDGQLETVIRTARSCMGHTQLESDADIEKRIGERFEIIQLMTDACLSGSARALIVSGPAGVGKSWTVEQRLKEYDPDEVAHTITKGFVRATGLFRLFWSHRDPGRVLVFDDADSIFFDETSLNMLKTVCDTTETRRVSWATEHEFIDEDTGEPIPRRFTFSGAIIFLTNYDFDRLIMQGHKLSPHLEALVSRAHYVDLSMRSRRDFLIRIKQVVREGMLADLTEEARLEVMAFIDKHADRLRELSLRIAIKISNIRKAEPDVWEKLARVTCLKQQ